VILPFILVSRLYVFRKLNDPKHGIGFKIFPLFNLGFLLINIFLLAGAIVYWIRYSFDSYLLWNGPFGGACDLIALLFAYEAFARGPAGPAEALLNMSALFFAVIEAVK